MHEIVYSICKKYPRQFFGFLVLVIVIDIYFFSSFISRGIDIYEIHFLDVGQGDAELVVLPNNIHILIDSGTPDGKILDALVGAGLGYLGDIDLIFISHPEADHVGGIPKLFETYAVGALVYSGKYTSSTLWNGIQEQAKNHEIPIYAVNKGDEVIVGDVRFQILSPNETLLKQKSGNESSLVLQYIARGVSALFVGDLGFVGERELQQQQITADILKIGHHGSKYSSSENFLNSIRPQFAVVEVGKNSYGHPTHEAMGRIMDVGAQLFRTDQDGSIIFNLLGDGKISIYKNKK